MILLVLKYGSEINVAISKCDFVKDFFNAKYVPNIQNLNNFNPLVDY